MRGFGLLLVLILLAAPGKSQLIGRVVDAKSGEALIGANVYSLSDYATGTVADINGYFNLDPNEVRSNDSLLISFVGYQETMLCVCQLPATIRLVEKQNQMTAVQILAEPIISEEFKRLEIKKIDIYTNPASKADALLAVNSMPSSTTTDESASVSLRGSSPIETGIFLNGVPVYDAIRYSQLNGIGTFSLFNTSLVQRVTLFPGNPPLEFGNTTSGVVSIQTDEPPMEDNSNEVILSLASLGFQRNQRIGKLSLKAFANYQPSGVLKKLNHQALTSIDKFESIDVGVYLYGKISEKLDFKTYGYALGEGYRFNFQHPTFIGDFDQSRQRALNVTNISRRLGAGTLSWNMGYSISKSNFAFSASEFEVKNSSIFQGFNYYYAGEKFHVKSGISYDRRDAQVAGMFFTVDYAYGQDHPTAAYDQDVRSGAAEVFVYSKYYLSEKWILGGGLRKNLNILATRSYLSEQLNLTYVINDHWKILGGIGNYNKEGFYENTTTEISIASNQASLDLFYERSDFNLNFSLFHKNIHELSQRTVSGLELFFSHRFNQHFDIDASYASIKNQSEEALNFGDIGYFIRSNFTFKPNSSWTISLNGVFREGTPYLPILSSQYDMDLEVFEPRYASFSQRHDDYFIVNLSASKLIAISDRLGMVAFVSVNNITDHKNVNGLIYNVDYSETKASYLSRRLLFFGCQLSF
ncbi:MAG: carboxypeptidase-like regulatory domain-containing protein [Cyclobacteriaceae bacterium]